MAATCPTQPQPEKIYFNTEPYPPLSVGIPLEHLRAFDRTAELYEALEGGCATTPVSG